MYQNWLIGYSILFASLFGGCSMPDVKSLIDLDIGVSQPTLTLNTKSLTATSSEQTNYLFTANTSGIFVYETTCQGNRSSAKEGNNTISFENLPDGYYDYCTVTLMDSRGKLSNSIAMPPFQIQHTEAPSLIEVNPIAVITNDATPHYTFRSSIDGIINYYSSCQSTHTIARKGDNTIIFEPLAEGSYSDCTLSVSDAAGNSSELLSLTLFTVDSDYIPTVAIPIN